MSETRKWIDKLNTMSTAEIRALMAAEGIKGYRSDSHNCVIAQFLKAKDEKLTDLCVSAGGIDFYSDGQLTTALPSYSLRTFIGLFDCGYYPELDARTPPQYRPKWTLHYGQTTSTATVGAASVYLKGGVINMTNAGYSAIKDYATVA